MTIYYGDSQPIIPDGMRRIADAYQSSPAVSVPGAGLIFVGTLADVVEITTYFTSMADLPAFANVKERFFTTTPYPAWTAIGVNELALPGLRVEIKATASLKNPAGPQR